MQRQHKPYLAARVTMTLAFVVAASIFWGCAYPHHLHHHEQYQLFLLTGAYMAEVLGMPGGAAELLSRAVIQLFVSTWTGALIMALLLGWLQTASWRVMQPVQASLYPLSFVPAILMWMYLCDENAMPTACISLVMAAEAACLTRRVRRGTWRGVAVLLVTPVMYLMAGPLALVYPLAAGAPIAYTLAGALICALCPIVAAGMFPYPIGRLYYGIHYHRYPHIIPWLAWVAALTLVALQAVKLTTNDNR